MTKRIIENVEKLKNHNFSVHLKELFTQKWNFAENVLTLWPSKM